jgi:hypothetical protein
MKKMKTIIDIKDINCNIPEGQLLMAALAIITTTFRTDKTPTQVLSELTSWAKIIYDEK